MAQEDQEYRQTIINRLRERNRRDVLPFKEIIQQSKCCPITAEMTTTTTTKWLGTASEAAQQRIQYKTFVKRGREEGQGRL